MASHEPKALDRELDVDRLKAKFDMSHFDLNAVLRGIQLTFVGGAQPPPREHFPAPPVNLNLTEPASQPRPPEPRHLHKPPL